jgi:hypothetical protein
MAALLAGLASRPPHRGGGAQHTAPASFQPGQPLELAVAADPAARVQSVVLHYRHANQAEAWQAMPMTAGSGGHTATIPAAYTDSLYPLIYYFELAGEAGRQIHPGFAPTLDASPYYLVLAAGAAIG